MCYNALSGLNYLEPIDTQGVALGCVGLAFQAGKSFAGWRLSAYAGDIPALHTRERPANKHHILWPLALSGYPLSIYIMEFEFDPGKSGRKKKKHGMDFVEAQAPWTDSEWIEIPARL